jgi:hypothetical protein
VRSKQGTAVWLLGLVFAVSGLACTSTQKVVTSRSWTDPVEACFNVRNVRTFSALHERYVYVRVRSDEHYLLTMDRPCMGLPFATGIAISGEFSRVCSDTLATLTYMDVGREAFCRIVRVEAVADKEQAERLVKYRTTPKPEA